MDRIGVTLLTLLAKSDPARNGQRSTMKESGFIERESLFVDVTVLHHESYPLEGFNIVQRVRVNSDYVRS